MATERGGLLRCIFRAVPASTRSLALVALLVSACSNAAPASDGGLMNVMETHPDATPIAPATECTVTTGSVVVTDRSHLNPCTPVTYPENPPLGGPHYSVWAAFTTYDAPVPWGFLVHSMEHGAVILTYNCPDGCPDVLSAFENIQATKTDPVCTDMPTQNRIVVVPDPDLPVPVAAVAWENAYLATCLDVPSLQAFVDTHYGNGPEQECAGGLNPLDGVWCP